MVFFVKRSQHLSWCQPLRKHHTDFNWWRWCHLFVWRIFCFVAQFPFKSLLYLAVTWWIRVTSVWPQQTVRLSCWSSMFNGIRPEPTNKRFNSAYLQIWYLISRKIHSITFWLDKTFSCWSHVTMSPCHSRRSGRGGRRGVIFILLKLVFFKIPDLIHRRTSVPVAAGIWR